MILHHYFGFKRQPQVNAKMYVCKKFKIKSQAYLFYLQDQNDILQNCNRSMKNNFKKLVVGFCHSIALVIVKSLEIVVFPLTIILTPKSHIVMFCCGPVLSEILGFKNLCGCYLIHKCHSILFQKKHTKPPHDRRTSRWQNNAPSHNTRNNQEWCDVRQVELVLFIHIQ